MAESERERERAVCVEVERLTQREIPLNVALARAVGWPDAELDWRVIHQAARVFGVRDGERLVAQGALSDYGGAGTIAKMIVAPDAQRRGLGGRILDGLLAIAQAEGIERLGLVATPQGQPLYERAGFRGLGQVQVWMGTPGLQPAHVEIQPLSDIDDALAFERRAMDCDRSVMLRARIAEASVALLARDHNGEVVGYLLCTEQSEQGLVGPVLARTERVAQGLIRTLVATRGARPIRIDIPAELSSFRAFLAQLGLSEKGARTEMALGPVTLPWRVPQRYALAAQAWG
jgi:predicted N-acetyltransferase YhbS